MFAGCSGAPRRSSSAYRHLINGALTTLLASSMLVACSSGSDDGALDIPTFDPEAMASAEASESAAAAAASASAAASAEAAGVVTAESLSTDRYEVTSIPEDLDEQQTEVLKAFINYDQVTWNIWFTGTGIEDAEPLTTPEEYQVIQDSYYALAGGRIDGTVRLAVTSIALTSSYGSTLQAEIRLCDDQSDLTVYDANNNDVSAPETTQGRYDKLIQMTNEEGVWKTASEETLSTNECWAES